MIALHFNMESTGCEHASPETVELRHEPVNLLEDVALVIPGTSLN